MRQETIAALAAPPCYAMGAQDAAPFSTDVMPEKAGADLAELPRDLAATTAYMQTQERRRLGAALGRYIGYQPAAIAGDAPAERRSW